MPLLVLLLFTGACGSASKPSGFAEPQLEADNLYVSLDKGKMAAVNSGDFSLIWEFPSGGKFACGLEVIEKDDLSAIYGAPVIDDGRVYFGAYDGKVYALDAASGECLWRSHKSPDDSVQCKGREPDGPIVGGMVLYEGALYLGSDDGQIWGIDSETGDVEACRDVGGAVWSTPLLIGDTLYVATMEGALWALQPGDWHPQWAAPFEVDTGLLSDPVAAGDLILVGGIGRKLYAIDAKTGEQRWEASGGNWFWGRPLVDGDTVYATNLDGKVYALNLDDGKAAWDENDFKAPEAIRAAPLLTGGLLVVTDRSGNLYSLDPQSGDVLKENESVIEKRVLANPIELNSEALIVSQDGQLYQYEPEGDAPARQVEVAGR